MVACSSIAWTVSPAYRLTRVHMHVHVFSRCSNPLHVLSAINFHRLPLLLIILQGILNAYQHAVRTVRLYGPTNFSSILDKAAQYASVRENQQSQSYFILLIITVSMHLG